MAVRVPWDEEEALLLLDAYDKISAHPEYRKELTQALSTNLRRRAIEKGAQIDETFRNFNGIHIRLFEVEKILHPEANSFGNTSEVLCKTTELYRDHRRTFLKRVKELDRYTVKILADLVGFSEMEAVVLLDGYLNMAAPGETRAHTARLVSAKLRALALNTGCVINDGFRSEGGINGRLQRMDEAFSSYDFEEKNVPEVFISVVTMYRTNQRTYKAILKEANRLIGKVLLPEDAEKMAREKQKLRDASPVKKTKYVKTKKERKLKDQFGKTYTAVYDALEKRFYTDPRGVSATELFVDLKKKYPRKDIITILDGSSWAKEVKEGKYIHSSGEQIAAMNEANKKEFFSWLNKQLPKKQIVALQKNEKRISIILSLRGLTPKPLFLMDDVSSLRRLMLRLPGCFANTKLRSQASQLVEMYIRYLEEQKVIYPEIDADTAKSPAAGKTKGKTVPQGKKKDTPVIDKVDEASSILSANIEEKTDYSFTKPVSIKLPGEQLMYFDSWRKLFAGVASVMYSEYPSVFTSGENISLLGGKRVDIGRGLAFAQMLAPVYIGGDYYVETNRSASDLMDCLRALVKLCGISPEKVIIQYKSTEENKEGATTKPGSAQDEHVSENDEAELEANIAEKTDYAFTKPISITLPDQQPIYVNSWRKLCSSVASEMYKQYPEVIASSYNTSQAREENINIGYGQDFTRMSAPAFIGGNYYVETNRSATELMSFVRDLVKLCGISPEKVIIRYKGGSQIKVQKEIVRRLSDIDGKDQTLQPIKVAFNGSEKQVGSWGEVFVWAIDQGTLMSELRDKTFGIFHGIEENLALNQDLLPGLKRILTNFGVSPEAVEVTCVPRPTVPKKTDKPKKPSPRKSAVVPDAKPGVPAELVKAVEKEVLRADEKGITTAALAVKLHTTEVSVKEAAAISGSVVQMSDNLRHVDSFIDWEEGAEQLANIIEKRLAANDGYVSAAQLYEYASADMHLFLNDNDMEDQKQVYKMAEYLFGKVGYRDLHLVFTNNQHISRTGENQVQSMIELCQKFGREKDGVFTHAELEEYLKSMGAKTGNLREQMKVNKEPIFLYYTDGTYMTAESIGIDDAWLQKAKGALDVLFDDVGDHIVLRRIEPVWYAQMPELPGGREWTPLLLQSILRFYSKPLGGAHTISTEAKYQSGDTLHAMLASGQSEISTFADAVAAMLIDNEIAEREFETGALRQLILQHDMIQGGELTWTLADVLSGDERFAWTADKSRVTVLL